MKVMCNQVTKRDVTALFPFFVSLQQLVLTECNPLCRLATAQLPK